MPTRIQTVKNAVGLDFGTHHALAFSDGTIVDNPRFTNQSQARVNCLAKKSEENAPFSSLEKS